MDLSLDYKQANKLSCQNCDLGLQKLRNCGGRYKRPAIIKVNGDIYRECPRSLTFNRHYESLVVSLYYDCRENKIWPYGKSMMQQTAYCKDLFEYLDGVVSDFKMREHDEQMAQMKKGSNTK